jgi:hypothetical protein
MRRKPKKLEPVPSQFESYDAAGEFWDTHDTTDYARDFTDARVTIDLKGRRFEIEIDEDVADMLRKKARRARARAGQIASRLLRKQLTA